jgi:hypothetical protein
VAPARAHSASANPSDSLYGYPRIPLGGPGLGGVSEKTRPQQFCESSPKGLLQDLSIVGPRFALQLPRWRLKGYTDINPDPGADNHAGDN